MKAIVYKTLSTILRQALPALAIIVLAACNEATSPYAEQAAERGRADAHAVVEAPEGTMARESAMLHIRATEHRLRAAGDSVAALHYRRGAYEVLDSADIIH